MLNDSWAGRNPTRVVVPIEEEEFSNQFELYFLQARLFNRNIYFAFPNENVKCSVLNKWTTNVIIFKFFILLGFLLAVIFNLLA
jgi:hypothetical protein